jgi:hypothetical protein
LENLVTFSLGAGEHPIIAAQVKTNKTACFKFVDLVSKI